MRIFVVEAASTDVLLNLQVMREREREVKCSKTRRRNKYYLPMKYSGPHLDPEDVKATPFALSRSNITLVDLTFVLRTGWSDLSHAFP